MDTDHDKIIRVEEGLKSLSTTVDEIKNNHLAHLAIDIKEVRESIGSINGKLAMWSGGIVAAVWILENFLR